MQSVDSLEQIILEYLRTLPQDKRQEVLDFVEFLSQKNTTQSPERLSLQSIAALPIEQRHQHLKSFIPAMAEDFSQDAELTEFNDLDIEDWDIGND